MLVEVADGVTATVGLDGAEWPLLDKEGNDSGLPDDEDLDPDLLVAILVVLKELNEKLELEEYEEGEMLDDGVGEAVDGIGRFKHARHASRRNVVPAMVKNARDSVLVMKEFSRS